MGKKDRDASKIAPPLPVKAPSKILFLSENGEWSRLAEMIFQSEGDKMEVNWDPYSRAFESKDMSVSDVNSAKLKSIGIEMLEAISLAKVGAEDLARANMVVLIQVTAQDNPLNKQFPTYSGIVEQWRVPNETEVVDTLLQNIKSLLVRLILKGGRRPTLPSSDDTKGGGGQTPGDKGNVRVRLESKGRGGKKVTVIFGLTLSDTEMDKLATELKQSCGTGGTVKDGTIEIQGDQCQRILGELSKRGYKAKRSGG